MTKALPQSGLEHSELQNLLDELRERDLDWQSSMYAAINQP